jgi:outer membrane lipopolysaccharide assembly protein LptE/RlpB
MKTKFFAFLLILIFAAPGFSQSVTVTPRRVVHRRSNTSTDYKKKYTVVYPKISGVSRRLKQKIERNLRYEKTFNYFFTNGLDEEYQLLDKAAYRVVYNKNDILNLRFSIDVSSAYESHYDKTVAVSLRTGELIKPEDVFIKSRLEQLAKRLDKSLQAEIKKSVREVRKDWGEQEGSQILTQFEGKIFTPLHLDEFEVSDKGITFVYKYEFAHIVRNHEPAGRFFLSYAQLKPFVRRDGLLGKFIK